MARPLGPGAATSSKSGPRTIAKDPVETDYLHDAKPTLSSNGCKCSRNCAVMKNAPAVNRELSVRLLVGVQDSVSIDHAKVNESQPYPCQTMTRIRTAFHLKTDSGYQNCS